MPGISIRDFQPQDVAALAALTTELGYPTTVDEMKERMNALASNRDYRTLVATDNDRVVGYAGITRNHFWERNGEYVRIQALVVTLDCRKTGVGKRLIAAAEGWARSIGAKFIFLNCGNREEREGAHLFYPKMGFQGKSTGYVKQL